MRYPTLGTFSSNPVGSRHLLELELITDRVEESTGTIERLIVPRLPPIDLAPLSHLDTPYGFLRLLPLLTLRKFVLACEERYGIVLSTLQCLFANESFNDQLIMKTPRAGLLMVSRSVEIITIGVTPQPPVSG